MIKTYVYDGSFDGFLTCVYEYYYSENKAQEIYSNESIPGDFIHELLPISTSEEKSQRVFSAIETKLGAEVLRNVFTVFLSEEPRMELLLLTYIRLGFKIRRDINQHLHNETVLSIIKTCNRVNFESHRLCGFIRFRCVGNEIYYAAIEPDHNILTLISPHFADRFSSQRWIIHDVKRQLASLYDCKEWVIVPMNSNASKQFLNTEDSFYEKLWKTYYNTISIEERENPKLRKRLMPSRYWKYIIETKT